MRAKEKGDLSTCRHPQLFARARSLLPTSFVRPFVRNCSAVIGRRRRPRLWRYSVARLKSAATAAVDEDDDERARLRSPAVSHFAEHRQCLLWMRCAAPKFTVASGSARRAWGAHAATNDARALGRIHPAS